MKISGGHTPRIAGRPSGIVSAVPIPTQLVISLRRRGLEYLPAVNDGDEVATGRPLAKAEWMGGSLTLPCPAAGRVTSVAVADGSPGSITLEVATPAATDSRDEPLQPQRADAARITKALADRGIWPFLWSSANDGTPALDGTDQPRAVIVNCVLTEPFRARGKVVLRRSWNHIVHGIKFLPRLLRDYGRVEIILTNKEDPVSRMMYTELAGHAMVRFHPVPLRYPVEHPRVLAGALPGPDSPDHADGSVWVTDIQGIEAIGASLGTGLPLTERLVAVGGPGCPEPKHLCVRIGTPVRDLIDPRTSGSVVLRGGLLTGTAVNPDTCSVGYDDDAFFVLPEASQREFLSFVRAGFTRTSAFPAFASALTGAYDSLVSTALRGEPRPCIACGLCENVCPARILPQVLHRYLYRQALDEAEALGLARCIDCGLCTYVCPSKIGLAQEFRDAAEQLRREREEARAAERSDSKA